MKVLGSFGLVWGTAELPDEVELEEDFELFLETATPTATPMAINPSRATSDPMT